MVVMSIFTRSAATGCSTSTTTTIGVRRDQLLKILSLSLAIFLAGLNLPKLGKQIGFFLYLLRSSVKESLQLLLSSLLIIRIVGNLLWLRASSSMSCLFHNEIRTV